VSGNAPGDQATGEYTYYPSDRCSVSNSDWVSGDSYVLAERTRSTVREDSRRIQRSVKSLSGYEISVCFCAEIRFRELGSREAIDVWVRSCATGGMVRISSQSKNLIFYLLRFALRLRILSIPMIGELLFLVRSLWHCSRKSRKSRLVQVRCLIIVLANQSASWMILPTLSFWPALLHNTNDWCEQLAWVSWSLMGRNGHLR